MIKFKDLQNKVYRGIICAQFEYGILIDENKYVYAKFNRSEENPLEWNMQIVFGRTRDKDSEVYNFGYVMPRDGLPLELIAATGLKYFQLYLQKEIQIKSNINFWLGDTIFGM